MKEQGLAMAREHREANRELYLAMGRAESNGSVGTEE